MIYISDVVKKYHTRHGEVTVLNRVNLVIKPHEKVGILGRNGSGKSTMIRLISGAEQPTSGLINRSMSVSWPLAFGGAFQGSLTGVDNLRFICRIYGVDVASRIDYVQEFSELGEYLREPVKTYSSGMRARLAFAISIAIEFDCFLIDEIIAVGDSRFHDKCQYELFEKRKDRAMIIVSHQPDFIKAHCDKAVVLSSGKLHSFDIVDEAMDFYHQNSAMA
jgi:capsular polysaccharide transport system ATP-binding protein